MRDDDSLWVGESDEGEGSGFGGDCLVEEDAIHGSIVLQLNLSLQSLAVLLQPRQQTSTVYIYMYIVQYTCVCMIF